MNKDVIKGTLIGVVGVSTITTGYYGFVKPNLSSEKAQLSQETASQTKNESINQSSGGYKDGTYTGSVVKTRRGDFQVGVDISGGRITNITMLTQPTNPESQKINANAIPNYTKEAIEIQGSEINMISGASEAYSGFKNSLQNALSQAR